MQIASKTGTDNLTRTTKR